MTRCCTAAGRETDNNPRTEAEGREVAPGSAHKKKMLKTKIEPTMCMKTNTRMTISPKHKDGISTELLDILTEKVGLLSLFERWGSEPYASSGTHSAEVQKCEE